MTKWEISDLVLPGTTIPEMDGLETFLKTRGIKLLKETPIAFLQHQIRQKIKNIQKN